MLERQRSWYNSGALQLVDSGIHLVNDSRGKNILNRNDLKRRVRWNVPDLGNPIGLPKWRSSERSVQDQLRHRHNRGVVVAMRVSDF